MEVSEVEARLKGADRAIGGNSRRRIFDPCPNSAMVTEIEGELDGKLERLEAAIAESE